MGTPKLYIASHNVVGTVGPDHSYLFYDPDTDGDNDPTTWTGAESDMRIIRGGSGFQYGTTNDLVVEVLPAEDVQESRDWFSGSATPASENFTVLFSGSAATAKFTAAETFATSLGTLDASGDFYRTPWGYGFPDPNSNSVINSVLSSIGVDFRTHTPNGMPVSEYPGIETVLDGSGSDTLTIFAKNTRFLDNAGADTIYLEQGASVIFNNDGNGTDGNTLILKDVDPGDITFSRIGNVLNIYNDGELIVQAFNHFKILGPAEEAVTALKFEIGGVVDEQYTMDLTALTSNLFIALGVNDLESWFNNLQMRFSDFIPAIFDPLAIDLDGDGIETVAEGSVYFDLDANGYAEAAGWVSDDDGLIVRDINANGYIDNGSELFGNATTHGFAALAALDSNSSGTITSADAAWSSLKIWRDANQDGVSQSDELHTLSSFNITSIDVTNVTAVSTGTAGGSITHTGTATTTTGTMTLANLAFDVDIRNTRYAGDYDFDIRAAFLPTLRGYANNADLHIALSLDNDEQDPDSLMSLMQELASYSLTDIFASYDDVKDTVQAVLYRWVEVEDINPTSRGEFLADARNLAFLEQYLGRAFFDRRDNTVGNPASQQAVAILDLWNDIHNQLGSVMLFQAGARGLFEDSFVYDPAADKFTGTRVLSQDVVDELEAYATGLSTTADRREFWLNVAEFFQGINRATGSETLGIGTANELIMNAAVEGSDAALTWSEDNHAPGTVESIEYRYFHPDGDVIEGADGVDDTLTGTANDDIINGLSGNDTLSGLAGIDIINGGDGNDTINGGEGSDILNGGDGDDIIEDGGGSISGNDLLIGGNGDDTLRGTNGQDLMQGGAGNDTYVRAPGGNIKYIEDESGALDTLRIEVNQTISTLKFERVGNYDMRIWLNNGTSGGAVVIKDQFNPGAPDSHIEQLYFTLNSTTVSFSSLSADIITYGTEAADEIDGITQYAGVNDTIHGYGGDDVINGGAGNDTINGGDGNDILDGGDGNNNLQGGAGNDTFYIGSGNNIVGANTGYDIIYLPTGIAPGDITYKRYAAAGEQNHAVLEFTGGATLKLENQFLSTHLAEEFRFSGGAVLYGLAAQPFTTYGSAAGETIDGISYGGGINDTIYGLDGNDTLRGQSGNDYLDGGEGNDTYMRQGGNDTFFASNGTDTINADTDGTQTLVFREGVTLEDLTFSRVDWNNEKKWTTLRIDHPDGTVYARSQFTNSTSLGDGIDYIKFGNDAPISVSTLTTRLDIIGTSANETITGLQVGWGNYDETLSGLAGNDSIFGRLGNDILDGGIGTDNVQGGLNNDTYIYGAGSGMDTFTEEGGTDTIHFGTGLSIYDLTFSNNGTYNTKIVMNAGTNEILLSSHRQSVAKAFDFLTFEDYGLVLSLTNYNNWLWGTASADVLTGDVSGSYADTILGGAGGDTIDGGALNDEIDGGEGDDTITGGTGDDKLYGGGGTDTLSYAAAASAIAVSLATTTAQNTSGAGTDTILGFENLTGSASDDTLTGDAGINVINGGAGEDDIDGGDGDDVLQGEAGDDTIDGGAGTDEVDYALASGGITASISGGAGTVSDGYGDTDTLTGIEWLSGSEFADDITMGNGGGRIRGRGGDDIIYAMGGNDTVYGGTGADEIYGGDGDDILYGEAGDDTIDGGSGTDTVDYALSPSGVTVVISAGSGTASDGYGGTDTLSTVETANGSEYADNITLGNGTNVVDARGGDDVIYTMGGNDTIYGRGGNDELYGGDGNDTIYGGDDQDELHGGNNDDVLNGKAGDDILYGDDGFDQLFGELGADTFVFEAASAYNDVDEIYDFNTGEEDAIDISDLLTQYDPLTELIEDFVQMTTSGSDTLLSVDADGGGDNFLQIATLIGVTGLTDEQDLVDNGHLLVA